MTAEEIIKDIKQKKYQPVYLLAGEEPYFIDQVTHYISENVLDSGEKEFNQTTFYGKDTDVQTILDAARRYPMMAERQVIIVKEAQHIKGFEAAFEQYFEHPISSTLLVLNYKNKKIDKRKKAIKALQKNGVFFQSDPIKEYKVSDWISKYVKSKKLSISDKALQLMVEFLGNDLNKISNEINKLEIVLPGQSEIDAGIIEKNIGFSKDYNLFELTNALGDLDRVKAQRIVRYFAQNPKAVHMPVAVSGLYTFFSRLMYIHFLPNKDKQSVASNLKIHPFAAQKLIATTRRYPKKKIAANISLLRTYDLKSKGYNNSSTSDGELLRELVFQLMH